MIRKLIIGSVAFAFSASAYAAAPAAAPAPAPAAPAAAPAAPAAGAPAAGAPDMTKMGPASRVPKNEKADKKELEAYFKANEEAGKKGDVNAMADMVDFPVTMGTDDSKGVYSQKDVSRDDYIKMMTPFMEMMKNPPKGMKMTMTGQCFILSDDLASCEGANTMTMGKNKTKTNSQMLMVRKDGKWKAKTMVEAGWGDMMAAKPTN